MSSLVAPPNHGQDGHAEGGEMDRLLYAFYRAELPKPWPAFQAPAQAPAVLPFPVPSAKRPLLSRSRLALAASVALLIGGLALLTGKFGGDAPPPSGMHYLQPNATHLMPGSNMPTGSGVQMKGPFIEEGELKVIIEEAPTGPGR